MATGDVTLSIAVEGGATKSVVIDSATRVKAKLFMDNPVTQDLSDDADWQVHVINKLASRTQSCYPYHFVRCRIFNHMFSWPIILSLRGPRGHHSLEGDK